MTQPSTETAPPDIARLCEVVAATLERAASAGASAAEAGVSTSAGLSVNVRLGEVETIEHTRDKSLGVTVYFGKKKGSASTTDLSETAVRETVAAACRIARFTSDDEYAGLADAELMAVDIPDLDLCHPWSLTAEAAIDIAKASEQAAREHDSRISNSDGAGVSRFEGDYVYGNSHGFLNGYSTSRHGISCSVIAEDDKGMQRDYWYSTARDASALEAPAAVGRKAAERTVSRLGARQVATQTVPVLYQADVARGLVNHLVSAIRGPSQYRRASFLLDALGERVLADHVDISEQPLLPGALGSAPFDNEGVATRPRDVVSRGVLNGYVLDSYSARKLGLQTTANAGGVHNLTVRSGEQSFEDLLRTMGTGLLVTELLGMGINIVTGDYSRGAAGFWVQDGAIAFPVEEVTVAGNLKEMFTGLAAVGTDIDVRGNIRTGSILIDRMTVAGE